MLNPNVTDYCYVDPNEKPRFVVIIDTEEERDWRLEKSRHQTAVKSLRWISRIQHIFDEYRITPVYAVDYPVVSHSDGYEPLQEIHSAGRCLIGAHLHPWVNPPFDEAVNSYNSFPGNLPRALEAGKLKVLIECIGERFGVYPTMYKAGRYGIGPNTESILEHLGFEIDLSICPHMDYSAEGGPDFSRNSAWPFWFGKRRRLLELPLTVGFAGLLRRWGTMVHKTASLSALSSLHPVGLLARLGMLDRIWLSPEGYRSDEHVKLVHALFADGLRVFSFAFHSPSVVPGNTPYVRVWKDLEDFLSRCRTFFDFFLGELGGRPATPLELKEQFSRSAGRIHMETA